MNPLLDLETKLAILAGNPCSCAVCAAGARLARQALIDVSPSGRALLDTKQGTPEFAAAERTFLADELARMQEAYDTIGRGCCLRAPPPRLDSSLPAPPPQYTVTPIPDLPDPELYRERVEFYRKHRMGPRMAHRRARIELRKNPRIPGSYVIKN